MLAKYYIEIDVICVIILAGLAYQTEHSNFSKTNRSNFMVVLIMNLIFVLSDVIWVFNNGFIPYAALPFDSIAFGYVMNGINVCFSAIAGWSWLYFSENFQDRYFISTRKGFLISLLPIAVLLGLTLTNGQTHFLFYMTEDGQYVREIGYAVQVILSYGYIVTAVVLSLLYARKAANLQDRRRSLATASFAILPTVAFIVQLFNPDMSVVFIGMLSALLNTYITLQEQQVMNDALTGLHNRMLLDQRIMDGMQSLGEDKELWLLIMDANKFKSINDTYGHLEGDRALKRIAEVLKLVCSDRGDFVCRYGGDEFVVLHKTARGEDCTELMSRIHMQLAASALPYELSVSIGAARYTEDIESWQQLIDRADQALYEAKRNR